MNQLLKILVHLGCAYGSKNPRSLGRGAFKKDKDSKENFIFGVAIAEITLMIFYLSTY